MIAVASHGRSGLSGRRDRIRRRQTDWRRGNASDHPFQWLIQHYINRQSIVNLEGDQATEENRQDIVKIFDIDRGPEA
jgi:hypothetical protein